MLLCISMNLINLSTSYRKNLRICPFVTGLFYILFFILRHFFSLCHHFYFFFPCHRACRILSCSCSVSQLCPTLYDPMDCSMPGLPVSHHLPESTKLRSIELMMLSNHLILCRPFSSCLQSFPASGSFQLIQFLHQVAKVSELQHQSFQ